jgi:hypothetical protein
MPVIMRGLRRFDQGGDYCTSSKPQVCSPSRLTCPSPKVCLIWREYYVDWYRGAVIDPGCTVQFPRVTVQSVVTTADRVRDVQLEEFYVGMPLSRPYSQGSKIKRPGLLRLRNVHNYCDCRVTL